MDIVTKADNVIQSLAKDNRGNMLLRTNQIRKFLTAVNSVANKVTVYKSENPQTNELSEKLAEEIRYLEVMLVYQVGRDNANTSNIRLRSVGDFVTKAELREKLKAIGRDISAFEEFNRYVEALVAFHKFYGGRDK